MKVEFYIIEKTEALPMFKKTTPVHMLISEQIKDVEEGLVSFENFMRAAVIPETPNETLRALAASVAKCEDAADDSLREMIESLSGQYLPATRQDLIALASSCDRIANKCEHTSRTIVVRRVRFPKDFGKVMGLFSKDVLEDFFKEHGNLYTALEKSEQKLLNKELNKFCTALVKQVYMSQAYIME